MSLFSRKMPVFVLALLSCAIPLSAAGSSFSLQLSDYGNVQRTNEVVTAGVPFPQGILSSSPIGSAPSLSVNGNAAQTRVLSAWPDQSARWVLLSFPNSQTAGEIKSVSVSAGGGAPSGLVSFAAQAQRIGVSTGPLSFVVRTGDNFIAPESVFVNSVFRGGAGSGGLYLRDRSGTLYRASADTVRVEESGPIRGCVYVSGRFKNGSTFLRPNNADIITTHSSPEVLHVRFMMRLYVYSGKSEIQADLILHNPGANDLAANEVVDGWCHCPYASITSLFPNNDGSYEHRYYTMVDVAKWEPGINRENSRQWLDVLDWYLTMDLGLSSSSSVQGATDHFSGTVPWGQALKAVQYTTSVVQNYSNGIQTEHYQVALDGTVLDSAKRGAGWMEVSADNKRLLVCERRFWERAPSVLSYQQSQLRVGLLPDSLPSGALRGGGSNYVQMTDPLLNTYHRVEGGRWIYKELYFNFSEGALDTARSSALARGFARPIAAVPEAAQLHESDVLDGFYPSSFQTESSGFLAKALERRAKWRRSFFEASAIEKFGEKSIPQMWDNTPATNYGWRCAGDINWTGSWPELVYSNLHYDWIKSVLTDYLREPSAVLWDAADLMATMRGFIGMYHHREGMMWADGGSWYEKSDHHFETMRMSGSHTWNGGLCLYYYLTGNPFIREAAVQTGDFCFFRESWNSHDGRAWLTWYDTLTQVIDTTVSSSDYTETRQKTWPMLSLLETYYLTGENKYLQMAIFLYRAYVIAYETKEGTQAPDGFNWACAGTGLQPAYAAYPLCRLYDALKERKGVPVVADNPDSLAKRLETTLLAIHAQSMRYRSGGFESNGTLLRNPKYVDLDSARRNDVYAMMWSALKGCIYKNNIQELGTDSLYNLLLEDLGFNIVKYDDTSAYDWNSAAKATATSFISNRFTGTETKVHGWDGLFYPYALRALYKAEHPVSVDCGFASIQEKTDLRIFPNPFNPETRIDYSLARDAKIQVELFDIKGACVKVLLNDNQKSGRHTLFLNTGKKSLASGVYFLKMRISGIQLVRKVVVLK
ncbi:MAG: T9SS type A sorting domain-containing protein [Fibrobacterota bacterium]